MTNMFLPIHIFKQRVVVVSFMVLSSVFVGAMDRDTIRLVRLNEQKHFVSTVPAGNYSGIAYLGDNEYVVVDDKSKTDGFHLFTIDIDSVTGVIQNVRNHGFNSSGLANRDGEGIAFLPSTNTILISGEADGKILEYTREGERTMREVEIPSIYKKAASNLGFEALGYSALTHRLWTCNESTLDGDGVRADVQHCVRNRLRIQSFNDSLHPLAQYAYLMDLPKSSAPSYNYAIGVPSITALDDGSLLVLEREFFIPPYKIGAFVRCKIFQVWPDKPLTDGADISDANVMFLDKCLIAEWTTTLGLFNRSLANYEGMCLGPRLADGSQVLVLVSDSQGQYAGVLRDWFKTIVLRSYGSVGQ